ncbi:MAG: putative toxin-antitoxin system toxin component, PIN family [Candidatus Omnitrophota bacterium]
MRVVIDTNVIVSGLLNPFKAPGRIVMMAAAGELELCYDGRILAEYREVLCRSKFRFDKDDIGDLLHQIEAFGYVTVSKPLNHSLPDRNDEPFLEVALASGVTCLITDNMKHYAVKTRQGMQVLSPAQFLTKHYS